MNKNNIAIVTAFFDIGRDNYNVSPRTKEQYYSYFKRWCRIKNDLYIYCDDNVVKNEIEIILRKINKDNFTIVLIDDIKDCNRLFYEKMSYLETSNDFQKYRVSKENCEDKANYNYVMYLKYYLLRKTLNYLSSTCKPDYLAWIDFGYEHGSTVYKTDSWKFLWQYNFLDRIVLFNILPLDYRSIETIASDTKNECIAGCSVIVPVSKVELFVQWIEESYNFFLNKNIMDDDQTFLLDVYRKHSIDISLVPSRWFEGINQFDGMLKKKSSTFIKLLFKKFLKKLGVING